MTYTGETLHHTFLKQGVLDGGNTSDLWLMRQYIFENRDSTYPLVWQDSQFSTQPCFTLELIDTSLIDPLFTIASDCSPNSFIRGVYHNGSRRISDLLCQFQKCEGCQDPNNYKAQNAYLKAPNFDLDAFSDDSVSFSIKNWKSGALSIGYNDDEVSYSTYIRQIQLMGFDTLGKDAPLVCKIVFFK